MNKILLDDLAKEFAISRSGEHYLLQNGNIQFNLRRIGSDIQVAHQIFYLKEYLPVVDFFKSRNQAIKTFLDLGGNIGLTSLFIHHYFLNAKIAIVEPDLGNFGMLTQNCGLSKLTDAKAFCKAIWFEKTYLKLSRNFADGQDWAVNVMTEDARSTSEVETITMQGVIDTMDWQHLDFIKIDIEGAEKMIFDELLNDLSFLEKVSVMAVEIHEDVVKSHVIIELLARRGFAFFQTGELHVFYK